MMLQSFSSSYVEARGKFLATAQDANARVLSYGRKDVKGHQGEALSCDVAILGPEDASKAAILITGTHGVEGFCGSAIMCRWLATCAGTPPEELIKIVLVHAINPWGFSYRTRTTENNVDLNRNFLMGEKNVRENPSHSKLKPFMQAAGFDLRDALANYLRYKDYLDQNGWQILNEMMEGQEGDADGFYYAGRAPEWSNVTFRKIINQHLGQAQQIGFIDWHTGLGECGETSHLIFEEPGSPAHQVATSWWHNTDTTGHVFKAGRIPNYRGLLCKAISQELPNAQVAGAVVEFGTADSYSLFRADCLDYWLRTAGRDHPLQNRFRADYCNAYCPNDVAWRLHVTTEGPSIINRMLDGVRCTLPRSPKSMRTSQLQ